MLYFLHVPGRLAILCAAVGSSRLRIPRPPASPRTLQIKLAFTVQWSTARSTRAARGRRRGSSFASTSSDVSRSIILGARVRASAAGKAHEREPWDDRLASRGETPLGRVLLWTKPGAVSEASGHVVLYQGINPATRTTHARQ